MSRLTAAVVAAVTLFAASGSVAIQVPGGGSARTDCYATFEVEAPAATSTREVGCVDGDPACDRDGACNDVCRFGVSLCVNRPGNQPTCVPPFPPSQLTNVRVKGRFASTLTVPPLNGSACGALLDVEVPVKVKRRGTVKRPGRQRINVLATSPARPKRDKDRLTLRCLPREGACPTTTTTIATTTTTTTVPALPACGDGLVNGAEQCDSPCQQGACGAGQVCNGTCQCITPEPCACGPSDPARFSFTTQPGSGTCGTVQGAGGTTLLDLECSGLYFGGGSSAVTLPAITPDQGTTVNAACCSGTTLTLAPATEADTGSRRTCTAQGCLYGGPLSIPNYVTEALSTCVINEVRRNSVGSAECTTGDVTLDLPLTSFVYLAGDLLNGAAADRPDVAGIQPCPICSATCAGGDNAGQPCTTDGNCPGGACGAAVTCLGGPNNGMPCTPETSAAIGARCEGGDNNGQPCASGADCPGTNVCSFPYPTSHDCPSGGTVIGELPIPYLLTTGTSSKTAQDLNGAEPSPFSDRVFCGFCRDADGTATNGFGICAGGTNAGQVCDLPTDCPGGTCGGEVTCTANADCQQPRETCSQLNNGAFSLEPPQGTPQPASTITETGTPAGSLVDGNPHPATLVSVFCIPPTYSPIDASASLPGPGAVSLPGQARIEP